MEENQNRKTHNVFNVLYSIDCSAKVKQANGRNYLSWAAAWAEVKKRYPESFYTVYEENNIPYYTDGKTCWVKTGVTIVDGDWSQEHIERLPIMDMRNNSVPLENVTSRLINDTIQRSLTKACARHGLGLYIYEGEDIPEETKRLQEEEQKKIDELEKLKTQIIDASTKKIKDGIPKETVYDLIASNNNGNMNPKAIEDPEVAKKVLADIKKLKKE